MSLPSKLLAFAVSLCLIASILYIAFGQITVRKLRKNPDTKHSLGVVFASGWDILNVAGALSAPKWLRDRYKKSSLAFLAADADVIYQHTNRFDRVLARIFYGCFILAGVSLIVFSIASELAGD